MELIYLFTGIIVGSGVAYFFFSLKNRIKTGAIHQEFLEKEKNFVEGKVEAEKQSIIWEERFKSLKNETENWKSDLDRIKEENTNLLGRLEKAKVEYLNLQEKLRTQKTELEEIQKKFTTEFENIANKILKKNSEEFTAANQKNLGDVLNPLKEKIQLFEKKVDDTYQKGLRDQTDLRAELKKLHDLNSKISEEANNLTRALKGDVKKQGNWGEVVLERILERSGLNEGEQGYQKQFSDSSEDGKRIQPDIVINLPDNKHIIVDSKVSLIAFERAVNSVNDEDRLIHLKEHLASLKAHIKGLSEKHYQTARKLNSPDFVLLFLPIEASFSVAIQEDQDLFTFAWDMKVVIVSPSTLLATLRTIASIWQQENQTKNALEIARQGGALYDKFVGFINDMENIGKNIETTQKTYDLAMNKLHVGSGNLVRRAENIKILGAKTTKELPGKMLEN
ncbi:MAG: DNA recombination protein RmuC [Prolixibacteraceae bacterium]|jgi:DNA recombination protein RmuC|nr:DNA recombination protein RmuC [Prolixibacteraceae bacterium]MBT6766616.1 DNA recombination protein RmuC [Prolixibacteraceae bacterium]MBT6999345.1 DNA recombination protein RmuC [Prolixibacteraceae bacterium]MBT7395432.1 DNA recombination protein RmuC [Prolixibacteraceae bacterium]